MKRNKALIWLWTALVTAFVGFATVTHFDAFTDRMIVRQGNGLVLFQWDKISISVDAEKKFDALLAQNRAKYAKLLEMKEPRTWENFVLPQDEMENVVQQTFMAFSHLNDVAKPLDQKQSDEQDAIFSRMMDKFMVYATELSQNVKLYEGYKEIADGKNFAELSDAQQASINNALRSFELSGVGLPPAEKVRFAELNQEIAALQQQFQANIVSSERAWQKCVTNEATLSGISKSDKAPFKENAKAAGCNGYLLTLGEGTISSVLSYADNRELREEVLKAYMTRASSIGPGGEKFDNLPIIQKLLAARQEEAKILGYKNYAEVSLVPKMARSTDEVLAFLNDMGKRSYPMALKEFEQLSSFAKKRDGVAKLESWDIKYYMRLLKEKEFSFSDEKVKEYYPLDNVLSGMFQVATKLYGVTIQERTNVPLWHKDARYFEISKDGKALGALIIDLFDRPGQKRGGGWMDTPTLRFRLSDGSLQLPMGYIIGNFKTPESGHPALLTMSEVETIFHEFGHNLQHLLTKVDVYGVSGIRGLPWDGVELASQFMENFIYEPEVSDMISSHYKTGEKLPVELLQKLRDSKTFGSGTFVSRQLVQSLYDFRLYMENAGDNPESIHSLYREVSKKLSPISVPDWNRFPEVFHHVFSGGYAAGYYSYFWADNLAADAYEAFVENGKVDWTVGKRFEKEILSVGSSRPFMESFVAFRGRPPTIDALLKKHGLSEK